MIFCVISLLPFSLVAQDTLVANYTKTIGPFKGVMIYEYVLKGTDSIKVGDFSFSNALLNNEDSERNPINIKGQFKNDFPHGDWHFEFNRLVPNADKSLINYKYVTTVDGTRQSSKFRLELGQPEGSWLTQIDSVDNSAVSSTLFKSSINYSAGVPIKNFSIESDKDIMVGRLLRDGLAQDVWSLYSKEDIGLEEDWQYDQGLLTQITLQSETENRSVDLSYSKSTNYTEINLDQHYLDIMQLRMKQQDTSFVFNQRMSELLQLDSKYYEIILDFFEDIRSPLKVQGFVVKVPIFPISSIENDQLQAIGERLQESDSLITDILTDAQMNILKISDAETAFLNQVSETVYGDYLKPLKQLINYSKKDVLAHLHRQEAIEGIWPNGFPPERIKVKDSLGNEQFYQLSDKPAKLLSSDLEGVDAHSSFVLELCRQLNLDLQQKLSLNKREKAFVQQERLLIAEAKSLEQYVDSVNVELSEAVSKSLVSLKSFVQRELKTYVGMPETEEKLEYSTKLATCFKTTQILAQTLKQLPDQEEEILELYVDQVWNPFTATVMDEEIKRRIIRAYRTQVIPYYLIKVEQELNCNNIEQMISQFENLHQRMKALRTEDTKRLERKLKRTKNPEEVINRLGIEGGNE